MSLDDDLARLEASDPAVRRARERLDDTTRSILSTGAEGRRLRAELGSALRRLTVLTSDRDDLRDRCTTLIREAEEARESTAAAVTALIRVTRLHDDLAAQLGAANRLVAELATEEPTTTEGAPTA